jgi:integrase
MRGGKCLWQLAFSPCNIQTERVSRISAHEPATLCGHSQLLDLGNQPKAMPRNRKSERRFSKPVPTYNGGEGFYVFVPTGDLQFASAPPISKAVGQGSRRQKIIPAAIKWPIAPVRPPLPQETFQTVAEEWFEISTPRWVETYRSRLRSRMDEDLLSELGDWLIGEIEPTDVLATIRKIEQRGAVESAKRILNMASSVFRYGVATGRCYRDPTADIRGALRPPLPPKHRTALPAKEMPKFMAALDSYDGEPVTKIALKLLILTFVRTGELRFAKWSEFENLDGTEPLWRIPAERMKLRRPHLVPLAPQAVTLLAELKKLTGKATYLLPAPTKLGVISENTLLFALYRMGYHTRATVHGFRATASTVLNEAQFNRDWIEIQLAHSDSTIRGVYNFAEWLPGRREMLAWWANRLESLQ